MKTYNQFLETPFSEEVKPEPPEEEQDNQIASKQKRQMQIKKQVLLKKMQAVRAGAGADIVASHTPEGEMVEAKVDTGTPEEKEKARNIRKFGVSHNVAGHGKLRRALHRSDRGYKKKKGDKSQYVEMEATDKAFEYVKKQIAAKYGKDSYVSKDNPRKPQTAAQKKAYAAHKAKLAKQDHRDPTEKASDGRYSDRHSNRGSD